MPTRQKIGVLDNNKLDIQVDKKGVLEVFPISNYSLLSGFNKKTRSNVVKFYRKACE